MFDLGIEGGTVVTSKGRARLHVYVEDERIAVLTAEQMPARERIEVAGLFVMPGMIDAHVHFMDPGDLSREDFPSGSAAAARSGVTTVIEHTHAAPVRTAQDLMEKRTYLQGRSHVDFALATHAWPENPSDAAGAWSAGAAFIKAFTCTTHGVPGFDAAHLLTLFERAADIDATVLVHCEDESLTAEAARRLHDDNREDGGILPLWRNRDAEATATAVSALLARHAGAQVVIAHVSHLEIVQIIEREQALGARLYVEGCPQYLTLLEGEALEYGPFRKFTPPARARSAQELEGMWRAVADGRIDYISSDHAPSTREQKQAGAIWDVHFGLPGIDTTMAVLLDAAHGGRLSYERVVEVYSERPARLYRLGPLKGRLVPGADADLVLVDPGAEWFVRDEDVVSQASWSPYAGRTLTGRAVRTYLRGHLIATDGQTLGDVPFGQFVAGPGAHRSIR